MHRDAADDACVVDQDVDHTDFLFDFRNHGLNGGLVGDVADIAVGFDAFFLIGGQPFVDQFLVDVVEADGGTLFGKRRCYGKADSV